MSRSRREFLQGLVNGALALAASVGGLLPHLAIAAEERPAFTATKMAEALAALGMSDPKASDAIVFKAPDIAENGAAVPVEIESKLANTRAIAILVEKNPHMMSALFNFPDGSEPYVVTRVKVAESSVIHAVVKTDAGAFYTTRLVKVTLGGCGG